MNLSGCPHDELAVDFFFSTVASDASCRSEILRSNNLAIFGGHGMSLYVNGRREVLEEASRDSHLWSNLDQRRSRLARRTLFFFRERGGGGGRFLLFIATASSVLVLVVFREIFVMVPLIFLVLLRFQLLRLSSPRVFSEHARSLAVSLVTPSLYPNPVAKFMSSLLLLSNEDPFAPFVPSSSPLHTLLGPFAFRPIGVRGLSRRQQP